MQEFQGVDYLAAFPLDTDLEATATARPQGDVVELRFSLVRRAGPVAHLATALRLVPVTDLGAVKATPFRTASLGDSVQLERPVHRLAGSDGPISDAVRRPEPDPSRPRRGARLGLTAPIVPGLLLVSLIQPTCEAALPGRLR